MKVPFLDLEKQHRMLKNDLDSAINGIISASSFIMGPQVGEFEKRFSELLGGGFSIGCASGTDALLVSLMALGIGPGDDVVTSPWSFFATAGCVARVGARPVFCDVDPDTGNMTSETLLAAVTPATKAVIPVHIYGRMADMTGIMKVARDKKIFVVEDACQSIGASMNGISCGLIGDTGCFSLFPTKNLGVMGDGGVITTTNEALAEKMKVLRLHGSKPKYHHHVVGVNSRLDTLQAAIGLVKIPHLKEWNRARARAADLYRELLSGCDVQLFPPPVDPASDVHHQFVIKSPVRDRIMENLKKAGVECGVYYPTCLHLQPCFSYLGYKPGSLPGAESLPGQVLSLPIYPEITGEQIRYVCDTIKGAL